MEEDIKIQLQQSILSLIRRRRARVLRPRSRQTSAARQMLSTSRVFQPSPPTRAASPASRRDAMRGRYARGRYLPRQSRRLHPALFRVA